MITDLFYAPLSDKYICALMLIINNVVHSDKISVMHLPSQQCDSMPAFIPLKVYWLKLVFEKNLMIKRNCALLFIISNIVINGNLSVLLRSTLVGSIQ